MYPVIISNRAREQELEEELELLRNNTKLDKEYFRQKYELKMKRRNKEKRDLVAMLTISIIITSIAFIFDITSIEFRMPIVSLILSSSLFISFLMMWMIFRRKYNSSEEKYSKHLKVRLARDYQIQQEKSES